MLEVRRPLRTPYPDCKDVYDSSYFKQCLFTLRSFRSHRQAPDKIAFLLKYIHPLDITQALGVSNASFGTSHIRETYKSKHFYSSVIIKIITFSLL